MPTNRSGSWWNTLLLEPDGVSIARSTNFVDTIRIRWLRQSVNRLPEAATYGCLMGSSLVAFATISLRLLETVVTPLNSIFLIGCTGQPGFPY